MSKPYCYDEIQPLSEPYLKLFKTLPKGAQRPISVRALSSRLGVSVREVYSLLSDLAVKYGVPVCGSRRAPTGIYIAVTEDERQRGLAILRAQNDTLQQRIEAVERADLGIFRVYDEMSEVLV